MSEDERPLTDDERAELEQLRAEKAAREEAERNRAEREELDRLRAERAADESSRRRGAAGSQGEAQSRQARQARRVRTVTPEEAAQIEHDREVRARNARLMEPDDDLSMPIGQKIALVAIFAFAIAAVLAIVLGPR